MMDPERIYLSTPHLSGFEQDFLFNSQNWLNVKGENLDKFEEDLQNYLNEEKYVAALNSGTSALHLALILLGVKSGDEVICQSLTFSASANPIVYLGAIPIFVDSETETWNICPKILEETIIDRIKKGKKPKAIIAVHLYGMPFKFNEIKVISQKYDIPIVEDSAEALGSEYKNQKCGTLGDLGVLSFNGNKIITTSGGGALIVNSKERKDKTIFLSTQARDKAPFYQHSEIGYNYRMNNLTAGLGRAQMLVLQKRIDLRRDNHLFYLQIFNDIEGAFLHTEPSKDFFSNYWLSVVLLNSSQERESLRLTLEKENIETRTLWKPMHLQPVFSNFPYYGNDISENIFNKGLCLPSGSDLSDGQKNKIEIVLKTFFL